MVEPCSSLNLAAFVDDSCGVEECVEIRQHLAGCATCAAECRALEELNAALGDLRRSEVAPAGLRHRVLADLERKRGERHHVGSRARRISRRRIGLVALGAIAAGATGIAVVPGLLAPSLGADQVVSTLIKDFETFLAAEHPLDYIDDDAGRVASWYRARVDFGFPDLPSNAGGYRLAGGRLCWLFSRRLAALVFEGEDGPLSLYVIPAEGLPVPEGRRVAALGNDVSAHRSGDYGNLIWRQGGLVLSLVGKAGPERLEEVARILSQASGHFGRSA